MNDALDRIATDVGDLLRWASFPRDDAELVAGIEAISTQVSRLEAARVLLVAQLDAAGVARRDGATSTAVWLRQRCRMSVGAAHRAVTLGKHLTAVTRTVSDRERLLDAVAAGTVTADQALVIGETVRHLPSDLGIEMHDKAEQALIDTALTLEPADLAKVGDRILDLLAPEVAEKAEAERLARQEREGHRLRDLHITVDHTGCSRISGRLDPEATAAVRLAIDALAKPLPAADGTRDPRSAGQRNADALYQLCRVAMDAESLPQHGGTKPQIIVTVAYDTLAAQIGAGTLDNGVRLSADAVRRLACDAQIIPAVLGSRGELLDLGRAERLISGHLRTALIARDQGCTFPGCDRPPRWCDGHHVTPWSAGGETSLANSTLLCGFHTIIWCTTEAGRSIHVRRTATTATSPTSRHHT